MLTFRSLKKSKLCNEDFKCLFDEECHVCNFTIRIIEKIHRQGISIVELAETLAIDKKEIHELRDAEHCNPNLVIRLCKHLSLEAPPNCPKLQKEV